MTARLATTWHGRAGTVVLGPTEHRVAAWLRDRTAYGLVTIRTVDLAAALGLERSEAYRITARLRTLGLFGIANDRGGQAGGRRIWRTAIPHDGAELDAVRHRTAWARVVAWARARRARLAARLAELRPSTDQGERRALPGPSARPAGRAPDGDSAAPATGPPLVAGATFRELLVRWGGRPALELLEALER